MRSDMKKVITERPRSGSKHESFRDIRNNKKLRDIPSKMGMKKIYGYERKSQSDVLGPLDKYLKSRIGEPWNEIWSDICQHNDARSVLGSHLRDHIRWKVELELEIDEEGELVYALYRNKFTDGFYVHPHTGLLCFKPRSKIVWNSIKIENRVNISGVHFYKIDGEWYELTFSGFFKYPKEGTPQVYVIKDAIFGEQKFHSFLHLTTWLTSKYEREVYCVEKRPATKKMIKKIEKALQEG